MSGTVTKLPPVEQLSIRTIDCKATLPAAVWRALSVAEQPGTWGEEISIVRVDDTNTLATVMPYRHYCTLEHRIRELEAWIGELMEEEAS